MDKLKVKSRKKLKKLKKLWTKYTDARNILFEYYWSWARSIGKIFARHYNVNFNDIETDISFGLLKALDKGNIVSINDNFDDNKFKKYAIGAIRMSIVDGIKDWKSVKVSEPNIKDFMRITGKYVSHSRLLKIKNEVDAIKEYVKRLEPFEKNLIYRRYFLGETLSKIGEEVGYSTSLLSTKCKEIINRMIDEIGSGLVG